jgi:PTH1 family peptidyl-tRNA hydrolase
MLLLVGLGNPGPRYEHNRHNVGFMAVDAIVRRHSFQSGRARFQAVCAEGLIDGRKTLAMLPTTFMNESGRAVGQAMRFYKLTPADIVVIYDELDLPPGKTRLKAGGGSAGHRGLRSIEAHIGKDFRRLRIGIGHPGSKDLVNHYVLHDFAKEDRDWLDPLLGAVAEHAPLLATGQDSSFMNRVHLAMAQDDDEAQGAASARPAPGKAKGADPAPHHGIGGAFAGLKKLFGSEPSQ